MEGHGSLSFCSSTENCTNDAVFRAAFVRFGDGGVVGWSLSAYYGVLVGKTGGNE
jgi:hypothetical protein